MISAPSVTARSDVPGLSPSSLVFFVRPRSRSSRLMKYHQKKK